MFPRYHGYPTGITREHSDPFSQVTPVSFDSNGMLERPKTPR